MLTILVPLALLASTPTATEAERLAIEPAACAASTLVRTTWQSDRRATVRTTTNGIAMPAYPVHEDRRMGRAFEVLECRAGEPQRLRVSYGEILDRRLDQDSEPTGEEMEPGAPTYTTERSPLSGQAFEIVRSAEGVEVLSAGGSRATPSLARLVRETEGIEAGVVRLPGDDIARALGAAPRRMGTPFEFDAPTARALLGSDEPGEIAATFTYLGTEHPSDTPPRARFEARITVHETPEGGLARDAELHGFLLADPRSGRPIQFEVEGGERRLGAAGDSRNATEIESVGRWRVVRGWTWR